MLQFLWYNGICSKPANHIANLGWQDNTAKQIYHLHLSLPNFCKKTKTTKFKMILSILEYLALAEKICIKQMKNNRHLVTIFLCYSSFTIHRWLIANPFKQEFYLHDLVNKKSLTANISPLSWISTLFLTILETCLQITIDFYRN